MTTMKHLLRAFLCHPFFGGFIIILPAVWPFLTLNLFPMHDYTHAGRIVEMAEVLRQGHFPPRWAPNFGFGYGMPLFSFYAPLPYFVGSLFYLMGASPAVAVTLVFWLTFYASFIGMYYLARDIWGGKAGWVAGTLFMYIPYRAVNTYVRGALGELWGILFLTLSLYMFRKCITNNRARWMAGAAITLAGLLLSHNLMALMGLPVLIGWTGYHLLLFGSKRATIFKVSLSGLLGLGLAAFYIFPAFLEKQYTSVNQLMMGEGDYELHFVYIRQLFSSPFGYGGSIAGPHDGMSFELGVLHVGLLIITALYMVKNHHLLKKKEWKIGLLGAMVVVGGCFLTSYRALPVWQALPLMSYFQFPWRFLALPMIFMPMIVGYWGKKGVSASMIIVTAIVSYLPLFQANTDKSQSPCPTCTDITFRQTTLSRTLPDYLHPRLAHLVTNNTLLSPPRSRFELLPSQPGTIKVLDNRGHRFMVEVTASTPFDFITNIFAFPGWTFFVNGKKIPWSTDTPLPRMRMTVPEGGPGSYTISGVFKETPLRLAADGISILSLMLVLLYLSYHYVLSYKR